MEFLSRLCPGCFSVRSKDGLFHQYFFHVRRSPTSVPSAEVYPLPILALMLFSFSLSPLIVSLILFILMLVAKTDQISSLLCTSSFELNRKINGSTSYACSSSATVEKRKKSEDGNKLLPIWSVFPSVHHRNDIGASSDA